MRSQVMANIAVLLAAGWRRRYLIVLPALLMPLVGLAVGLLSPREYESHTTILIQEAARQNPFLEDLAVATNLKKRMAAMNALLHSQHVLGEVVLDAGMVTESANETTRQGVIALLSNSLRVALIGDELVRISYVSSNPDGMAELLSLVSRRFVERVVAPERSTIDSSEAFLEQELATRKADLKLAEDRLATYKSRHADELPDLYASNGNRLNELRDQLSTRQLELDGALAARANLRRKLAQTNPVVGRLEERIVDALSELAILRARYTNRHTSVQALMRRLGSLEEERSRLLQVTSEVDPADLERLWNLASSRELVAGDGSHTLLVSQLQRLQEAESRIEGLRMEILSLERDVADVAARVTGAARHEQRLAELVRELETRRKVYGELSERYQNARVTGALGRWEESERIKLIDPPFTPAAPRNLPLVMFLVAGLFGGLAFGIGLAAVRELADTSIRRRATLEQLLEVPVLARIPVLPLTA